MNTNDALSKKVDLLSIHDIKYHIFLCCDQTNPKCCNKEDSMLSWEFLKNRLDELKLTNSVGGNVFRTKANCLRVCMKGPIAVVYPEGIWYHSCSPENLEKIIQQHFILGIPIKELML
jgi:(2Fe-2S) ferredoxin